DSASAREQKGSVARRGLCGDVYLVSGPAGARLADVRVATSVRKHELTVNTTLDDLTPEKRYKLRARILEQGARIKEFTSAEFGTNDVSQSHFAFSQGWAAPKLWDLHTPTNQYE